MITAPFNFVPLSEKVFFPDWAEDISHDIPFEDGESGAIDITITAKSPIFIRNHSNDKDNPSSEFCNHNGEYYIPSTTVKGMVRNVLEIMSFSKMSQFDDDTYAVRDLNNSDLYMSKMKPANVRCGWLKKDGTKFIIEDCGRAGRIKHEEIGTIFNMDFASKFKKDKFGNKPDDKTAKKKYDMIDSSNFTYNLKHTTTSTVGDKRYAYDKDSSLKGTIVLTGQPSGRDESREIPSGKVYEFVFFESKKDIAVDEKVMENFLFAYFDKRTTEPKESPDWKYWKEKLNKGKKVPVFFQKKGGQIAHFGLSYLYKLPYKNSVKDGLPKGHTDDRLDLSQVIFGHINKDKALKGRVQFSHFKATSNTKELPSVTAVLGTPRASYYPIYVKQQDGNLYKTFMDEFSISGWKRYPIQRGIQTYKIPTDANGKINEKVGTTFTALKEGCIFKGKLRYHNLKKAELGAILSSLTFHGTPDTFHNIGMAKPLGYGKIDIKIDGIENLDSYLKASELTITEQIPEWSDSPQLKELLAMATEQNNSGNSILKYMELEQFAKNKTGSKHYLKNYTALDQIDSISVKSFISQSDLDALKVKNQLYMKKQKKAKEFQKELFSLNYENLQVLDNFIAKYPDYEKIDDIKTKKESLRKAQESDKFAKVDQMAKNAYEALQKKKGNIPQYKRESDKFIRKWEAKRNNKDSEFVLDLVERLK